MLDERPASQRRSEGLERLDAAVVGIATGLAAGVFHAGRYFGWWN